MGLRGTLSLLLREAPRVTALVAGAPGPVALPGPVEGTLQALGIVYQRVVAPAGIRSLRLAREVAARLPRSPEAQSKEQVDALQWLLEDAWKRLARSFTGYLENSAVRQLWAVVELGLVLTRGILRDGVLHEGFNHIDGEDFREWLRKHGASDFTLHRAPLVKAMYALLFAYVKGDPDNQRLAAGEAARFLLRMGLAYKGAYFWKMQGGMGDVVFAPLYEVLKRRGVEFHFFHEVKQLRVNPLTRRVERVEMRRQVELREPEKGYQPLVDVKGLPCWPDRPLYEQLVDGAELEASGIHLESSWAPAWKGASPVTLERGRDYDELVLGISIGAFPHLCQELLEHSARWRRMVEALQTNQTQALQLWLEKPLEELGWKSPPTVMTAYAEPLNTCS